MHSFEKAIVSVVVIGAIGILVSKRLKRRGYLIRSSNTDYECSDCGPIPLAAPGSTPEQQQDRESLLLQADGTIASISESQQQSSSHEAFTEVENDEQQCMLEFNHRMKTAVSLSDGKLMGEVIEDSASCRNQQCFVSNQVASQHMSSF